MAETQSDRIENLLKILIETQTTISLTGTSAEKKELVDRAKTYAKKPVG